MTNRPTRRTLISAGFVTAFAAISWYLLDSGFCFSQMRYLSNRELIVEAIRFNKSEMKIDGSDESIDEFLAQNTKCCYVDRHPNSRTFLDVCTGFNVSQIVLNHEKRLPVTSPYSFQESHISVSACGKALKYWGRMSHSTHRKTG